MRALALGLSVLVAATVSALAGPQGTIVPASDVKPLNEHELKAAFVYNFIRFTTWPESAFEKEDEPLVVTIVGKSPLSAPLTEALKDKLHGKRKIVLRTQPDPEKLGPAHVLILGDLTDKQTEALLAARRSDPVLVIGDEPGLAARGATINFFMFDKHVRFEVNTTGMKRAGLEISSQLLKLARIVEEKKQ